MPAPPWRINEVLERAETGPICTEKDFDTKILFPNLKRVIKEYDIRFDPEQIVFSDDSLADDLWKAAWDFYLSVGSYCTNTYRRILFTEREIKEAMSCYVEEVYVGEGKDRRRWAPRKVEDTKLPGCGFTPVGVRCDEDLFIPYVMAYVMEPLADAVSTPVLEDIEGLEIKTGAPSEIRGAVVHAMLARQAARRAGRPGIAITLTGTALLAAAQIATSVPEWGCKPTDIRWTPILSELKVGNDELDKMIHFHQNGYVAGCLVGPIVGGYAGPEGTAIIAIASHIMGLVVNQGYITCNFPFEIKNFSTTTKECLWTVSAIYQALARNTRFITLSNGFAAAGPCTDMVLYETAAHGITSAVSGASVLWESAVASNKYKERATPMESRMACESGLAVVRSHLKREGVNEIVKELLKRYESRISSPPLGKTFRECYDVEKKKPTQEYMELYEKIRKELQDLGIEYEY
ncbi:MAG: monomethylamine:corrinoid methyltransferase [Candidatus Hadarchaeum sp.]